MVQLLNPHYFNNRGLPLYDLTPFIHDFIEGNPKKKIEGTYKKYQIHYSDLLIYVAGDNIEGKYSANTPLVIYLYAPNLQASPSHFDEFAHHLQIWLTTNRIFREQLGLQIKYKNPNDFPSYYDLNTKKIEYRQAVKRVEPQIAHLDPKYSSQTQQSRGSTSIPATLKPASQPSTWESLKRAGSQITTELLGEPQEPRQADWKIEAERKNRELQKEKEKKAKTGWKNFSFD